MKICRLCFFMLLLAASNLSAVTFHELSEAAVGLKRDLQNRYQISAGVYFHVQFDKHCLALIESIGTCQSVNEGAPYGLALLPTIEGEREPSVDFAPFFRAIGKYRWAERGLTPVWRLDRTEAVVLMGITPPNGRYFSYANSWREKLSNGIRSQDGLQYVMAETDLPINDTIIKERLGKESAFNQGIVVVTTANYALYVELKTLLIYELGIDPERIFLQKIPTADIDLPMSIEGSSFIYLNRVAYSIGADDYLDNPPVLVFRVTPLDPEQAEFVPIPMWHPPDRKTGASEDHLRSALNVLSRAVKSAHAGKDRVVTVDRFVHVPLEASDCLIDGFPFCSGMVGDAVYGGALNSRTPGLGSSPNDFDVVVGVNHARTGKARFTSIQFNNTYAAAVASFTDVVMDGASLDPYLPHIRRPLRPLVEKYKDQLYAIKVSRYCEDGDQFCVKVEYPSDQVVGLEDGESYGLTERIYREPTTTFGPDPSEVLPPRLISSRERGVGE